MLVIFAVFWAIYMQYKCLMFIKEFKFYFELVQHFDDLILTEIICLFGAISFLLIYYTTNNNLSFIVGIILITKLGCVVLMHKLLCVYKMFDRLLVEHKDDDFYFKLLLNENIKRGFY